MKKTVLITGASEGLGKAIAIRLSKENYKIILVARSLEKLKEISNEINKNGGESYYYPVDISNKEEIDILFQKLYEKFNKIDILLNNAGITKAGNLLELSFEDINQIFQVNTIGLIYITKNFLLQKEIVGTTIINTSSSIVIHPIPGWETYIASKAAVKGFTESLIKTYKPKGVNIIGFYPSAANTNIFNSAQIDIQKGEWMMEPKDIAELFFKILELPSNLVISQIEVSSSQDLS